MVRLVWEAKRSTEFLEYAIPLLVKEHAYWTSSIHSVQVQGVSGKIYNLSRYAARWSSPRPESYRCGNNPEIWHLTLNDYCLCGLLYISGFVHFTVSV